MKKRISSLLLCLVMCLTLVPMTAFATGTEEVGGTGKTLPYSFDFETDMAAEGWTNIDADGDEYDWRTDTDALWDEKLGIDEGHCAISRSYVNNVGPRNADNWLFSPAITIPEGGATVSWYEQSQDVSYPDFYEVYVSETNTSTDTSKMTKIFSGIAANLWDQRSVELEAAEYAGKTVYIAFRHLCYDCYILEIDNFAVGAEAPAHTHTVTFDANDGSVTPTSAETGTDGKLATLPTPTRSGSYSFDGWYTMKEGGTKVDTNTVFTAAATIYAHWSRSFSFAHLPETGVANITVPAGDYYTGLAARDAFIRYLAEKNINDGDFILIDYVDTYNNNYGYHCWTITIENGVAEATEGGFQEYYTTLGLINNEPYYASYDKWVNGTFECDTHSYTNYVVKDAATLTDDGILEATCDIDGCDAKDTRNIPRISSVKTSTSTYTYNGKVKSPSLTVKDAEGNVLTKDTDYTVTTPSGRKNVGTYTYNVTFKGNYSGTETVSFKINPATPSIKSVSAGKKKMTVKMPVKPSSKGASTYQIYYKQKGTSKWKSTTTTAASKTIKSLKKKKQYYVKVRAYKKVGTTTYYGAWSKTKLSKKIK